MIRFSVAQHADQALNIDGLFKEEIDACIQAHLARLVAAAFGHHHGHYPGMLGFHLQEEAKSAHVTEADVGEDSGGLVLPGHLQCTATRIRSNHLAGGKFGGKRFANPGHRLKLAVGNE
jgi:hypothetical protein